MKICKIKGNVKEVNSSLLQVKVYKPKPIQK